MSDCRHGAAVDHVLAAVNRGCPVGDEEGDQFSDLFGPPGPAISQKMLIHQLRQMEAGGIVRRIVHHQVPPKVEYSLTNWGQALCPALDALLKWAALRGEMSEG